MNADLRVVLARKEELVRNLEAVLTKARTERDAIDEEVSRILQSAPTQAIKTG